MSFLQLCAKSVSEDDAKEVARNWSYKKKQQLPEVKKVLNDHQLLKKIDKSETTMYLIQLQPKGWVLVSADDIADPILAYSFEDTIDDKTEMPPQVKWLLGEYDTQISEARKKGEHKAKQDSEKLWKKYKKDPQLFIQEENNNEVIKSSDENVVTSESIGVTVTSVRWGDLADYEDDLIKTTWGQGQYYNSNCPYDAQAPNDQHAVTGCVATAMAQIMRFHMWPVVGNSSYSYTDNNEFKKKGSDDPLCPAAYGYQTANFGATSYNFAYMPEGSLSSYNDYVAQLMKHAGISVKMDYGRDASATWGERVPNALQSYFRYWTDGFSDRSNYNDNDWGIKIRQNIRQGFPVYYQAADPINGAHAFVITGFEAEGMKYYYMNFGWYGYFNGWYRLKSITPFVYNFSDAHAAIFHIKPNNTTYRDRYEPDNSSGNESSFLGVNHTQVGHSIEPANDVDWIVTVNDTAGNVTFQTLNTNGDTRMWLYDFQGNLIAYNDNYGNGGLSKITVYLPTGRYFIKIDENGNNNTIPSYDVRISR